MIHLNIDKTNKIPVYQQIVDQVKNLIHTACVRHLDVLPSETQFNEIYNVSPFVVKRAYKILENQNLIMRIKGKGTFINLRRMHMMNSFDLESMVVPNHKGQTRVLLSTQYTKGEFNVYQFLKLPAQTRVTKYLFLTKENLVVSAFSILYVKNRKVFNEANFFNSDIRLKTVLEATFDTLDVVVTIHAANADKTLSSLLDIKIDSPLIVINSVYHKNDEPVVHVQSFYPGQYSGIEAILNDN